MTDEKLVAMARLAEDDAGALDGATTRPDAEASPRAPTCRRSRARAEPLRRLRGRLRRSLRARRSEDKVG